MSTPNPNPNNPPAPQAPQPTAAPVTPKPTPVAAPPPPAPVPAIAKPAPTGKFWATPVPPPPQHFITTNSILLQNAVKSCVNRPFTLQYLTLLGTRPSFDSKEFETLAAKSGIPEEIQSDTKRKLHSAGILVQTRPEINHPDSTIGINPKFKETVAALLYAEHAEAAK